MQNREITRQLCFMTRDATFYDTGTQQVFDNSHYTTVITSKVYFQDLTMSFSPGCHEITKSI